MANELKAIGFDTGLTLNAIIINASGQFYNTSSEYLNTKRYLTNTIVLQR